jgi:hypothetical protein
LNQIKETRNSDLFQIRKRLANQLKKYEGVMLETDKMILQMHEVIHLQREGHGKNKARPQQDCFEEAAVLDAAIVDLR